MQLTTNCSTHNKRRHKHSLRSLDSQQVASPCGERYVNQAATNQYFEANMNFNTIKNILSSGQIASDQVNPIINTIKVEDLASLTEIEKEALTELVNKMLFLIQDSASGAYLENPEKAELIAQAML